MTGNVLVTGASGFLANHIIGQLLENQYSVIGTIRTQSKRDSLNVKFQTKYPNNKLELVIVEDISKDDAFDEIFQNYKDITVVLHTASPFSFGSNESDLKDLYLNPAVNGTLNVLKSVQKYAPQVTNVVVTSSFAAVSHDDKLGDPSFIHTEETWNPIEWNQVDNQVNAYFASKKLAEKAAWEFHKENNVNFQLNTIIPPLIIGPQFFSEDATSENLNTSAQAIAGLLKTDPTEKKLFNDMITLQADVRDVAKFHLLAFEKSGLGNVRLLPVGSQLNQQLALNAINENIPQLKGKIAIGQPDGVDKILKVYYDNSKTIERVGGYDFIPFKETIVDSVNQIIN